MAVAQLRRELAVILGQIADIALEHAFGVVVGGGVHHLRQIDDHWPVFIHQHVEFRQVTVHQPGAQHAHRVVHHQGVIGARLFRRQDDIAQAWRHQAFFVGDQLHQQHAVQADVRLRHPHPGLGQQIQRVHFGVLPGFFLLLAAEFGAFAHGALVAAVAHLASFLIVIGLFVHFGAADLIAAAHDKHVGFFAAFQPADDVVD